MQEHSDKPSSKTQTEHQFIKLERKRVVYERIFLHIKR